MCVKREGMLYFSIAVKHNLFSSSCISSSNKSNDNDNHGNNTNYNNNNNTQN